MLKILSIGNRFSEDAQRYLYGIAESFGKKIGVIATDETKDSYLGDVIIRPEYQGMGIGTEIVTRLKDMVMEVAEQGDNIMFILGAAAGKEGFYEKLGFKVRPNEFNGSGMSMWSVKE